MENDEYKSLLIRSTLGFFPILGGPAVEFYSAFVDPVNKRKEKFLKDLYNDIEQLKKDNENLRIENLKTNENFITSLMIAIDKAIKITDPLKTNFFKNIVLNFGIRNFKDVNNNIHDYFKLTEELTNYEIVYLKLISKGEIRYDSYLDLHTLIDFIYPEEDSKKDILKNNELDPENFAENLRLKGLINVSFSGSNINNLDKQYRTTNFGIQYLMIINLFDSKIKT